MHCLIFTLKLTLTCKLLIFYEKCQSLIKVKGPSPGFGNYEVSQMLFNFKTRYAFHPESKHQYVQLFTESDL